MAWKDAPVQGLFVPLSHQHAFPTGCGCRALLANNRGAALPCDSARAIWQRTRAAQRQEDKPPVCGGAIFVQPISEAEHLPGSLGSSLTGEAVVRREVLSASRASTSQFPTP